MAELQAFMQTPAGLAIQVLLLGTFLSFALGVLAALRDGTFQWQYVDSFVRSTIWGRVAPAFVVLVAGYLAHSDTVTAAGIVTATAVGLGLITAALTSIAQLRATKEASAGTNTPPTA